MILVLIHRLQNASRNRPVDGGAFTRLRHPQPGDRIADVRLPPSPVHQPCASVEPEAERHVTTNAQTYVPGDRNRILLPLAFCRECATRSGGLPALSSPRVVNVALPRRAPCRPASRMRRHPLTTDPGALPLQLMPELAGAVDPVVGLEHPGDLLVQPGGDDGPGHRAGDSWRRSRWTVMPKGPAQELDSETTRPLFDEAGHLRGRSSSWAKTRSPPSGSGSPCAAPGSPSPARRSARVQRWWCRDGCRRRSRPGGSSSGGSPDRCRATGRSAR